MRIFLWAFLMLLVGQIFAQNKIDGLVLDIQTKKPIEYADIYNTTGSTYSNEEGRFRFQSIEDSIHVAIMGFEPLHTTFQKLKSDTIYLKRQSEVLDHVILSHTNSMNDVYKNIEKNYPTEPFTDFFFMRCVLKKNGEIVRLQDLSGLLGRKSLFANSKDFLPKNNYSIEIQNMRKAGIEDRDADMELFSFEEFLSAISSFDRDMDTLDFTKIRFKDSNLVRYDFVNDGTYTKGYFLVDNKDNAFNEYYSLTVNENRQFEENRGMKFRTIFYELLVTFKKNYTKQKYLLDKAKLRAGVETVSAKGKKSMYEAEYHWIVQRNTYRNIKNKVPLNQDVFTLTHPYNPRFWEQQNQLLLTSEMQEFVDNLAEEDTNFRIVTNMEKK